MERKLGIIGYGRMGSWHAESVNSRINGLTVCAAFDIDPERCKAAENDGIKVYATIEEFFASGIDLVLVATPNNFHKHYCILAMEAGLDVVCEKPACMNCEEFEEVVAVAEKTGRFFTVHQNRRYDIDYAVVREIINKKLVGNVTFIDSRLTGSRGCSTAWRSTYDNGGGALYDWGIHLIDQILFLVDSKPKYVFAELQHLMYSEVDDGGRIIIGFENGVKAQIVFDFWCFIPENRWRISGDDGTATLYDWFKTDGKVIKANQEVEMERGCVYTPNGLSTTMWPRPKQEIIELEPPKVEKEPRWEEFYENVLQVLDGKAKPFVTHEQVRSSMKVMMSAFESDRTKTTVHF